MNYGVNKKPDGYPELCDGTDRDSILKHLKEVNTYYQTRADSSAQLLKQVETTDVGPGRPAVHKEFGNCFVTKMWPKLKENKIMCAITFNPKPNPKLDDAFGGRRVGARNTTVSLEELMPYNETTKILFED